MVYEYCREPGWLFQAVLRCRRHVHRATFDEFLDSLMCERNDRTGGFVYSIIDSVQYLYTCLINGPCEIAECMQVVWGNVGCHTGKLRGNRIRSDPCAVVGTFTLVVWDYRAI